MNRRPSPLGDRQLVVQRRVAAAIVEEFAEQIVAGESFSDEALDGGAISEKDAELGVERHELRPLDPLVTRAHRRRDDDSTLVSHLDGESVTHHTTVPLPLPTRRISRTGIMPRAPSAVDDLRNG
jgi:hypothetical protein